MCILDGGRDSEGKGTVYWRSDWWLSQGSSATPVGWKAMGGSVIMMSIVPV